MKDLREKTLALLNKGYCTPQISRLASELRSPSPTIHYNIRKLEETGIVRAYKAVLDHKKAGSGFSCFILINLDPGEYSDPEKVARQLAGFPQVESCDVITGDWELVIKVRTESIDAYYEFVKRVLSRKGIGRTKTLASMKELKSEFVEI